MQQLTPEVCWMLNVCSQNSGIADQRGDEKAASLDVGKAVGFYPEDFSLKPCEVDVNCQKVI